MDTTIAGLRASRPAITGLRAIEITIDTSLSIVHKGMILITTEDTDLLIDTLPLLLLEIHIPLLDRETCRKPQTSIVAIHVIRRPLHTTQITLPLHPRQQDLDMDILHILLLAHPWKNLDRENVPRRVPQDGLVLVQFHRKSASTNLSPVVTTLHLPPSPRNHDPLITTILKTPRTL
jgi:hypothetical protein